MIQLYTIGFTGKSAEKFFTLLQNNDVERLVDTRINNTSQLSGFAKAIVLMDVYTLSKMRNISQDGFDPFRKVILANCLHIVCVTLSLETL